LKECVASIFRINGAIIWLLDMGKLISNELVSHFQKTVSIATHHCEKFKPDRNNLCFGYRAEHCGIYDSLITSLLA
jgi:hypothetical protein